MTETNLRSCSGCKFGLLKPGTMAGAQPVFECRKDPPHVQAVIAVTPQGPQHLATITVFPEMTPNQFCHQWVPRLMS